MRVGGANGAVWPPGQGAQLAQPAGIGAQERAGSLAFSEEIAEQPMAACGDIGSLVKEPLGAAFTAP